MMLARTWNSLSPEFRALYKQAAQIPSSFRKYDSPGGHFEVYYTLSGLDQVDSSDNYGFSTSSWSIKTGNPNGTPDYIDEVAWALDSSWSILVDKSGFVEPIPHRDNSHMSDKYKVLVEQQQNESTYGLTFMDDNGSAQKGFPSFITLRNDWSGSAWREWGIRNTLNTVYA